MKKTALRILPALLACSLCACAPATPPAASSSAPMELEALHLELFRSGDDDALLSAMTALPQALGAALSECGVHTKSISLSVGTSPSATAQALRDGSVELAVFSADDYVTLGENALPLLTNAVRTAGPDSAEAADWTQAETTWNAQLSGGQRLLILAGPSDYGAQLSARAASKTPLTWEELDKARWAVGPSEGGMVSVWLADRYEGNTLSDLSAVTQAAEDADGNFSLLSTLAGGDADVAVVPADLRIDFESQWRTGCGRSRSIWEETRVLGVTEKRYDVILAANTQTPLLSTPEFQLALGEALSSLCAAHPEYTPLFGGVLSAPVADGDLDAMRRLATLSI